MIQDPGLLGKDTLFELRSLLARHPYYEAARLLLLQNLYLLHDPTFDEELRRAALYIGDRQKLFSLVEAAHYRLRRDESSASHRQTGEARTLSLIDSFLDTIPKEEQEQVPQQRKRRKPTAKDATVDYAAYLAESSMQPTTESSSVIDEFLSGDGTFDLKEKTEFKPEVEEETKSPEEEQAGVPEGYFTETLASIYIKQGKYSQALAIIRRLNLEFPKKNIYFADQIRFLEKLVQNEDSRKAQ